MENLISRKYRRCDVYTLSPQKLRFRGSPRFDPYARAALTVRGSARCKNRGTCPRFLRKFIVLILLISRKLRRCDVHTLSPQKLCFRGSPRGDPYARAALTVRGSARCKNRGACPRFLRYFIEMENLISRKYRRCDVHTLSPQKLRFRGNPRGDPYARTVLNLIYSIVKTY